MVHVNGFNRHEQCRVRLLEPEHLVLRLQRRDHDCNEHDAEGQARARGPPGTPVARATQQRGLRGGIEFWHPSP